MALFLNGVSDDLATSVNLGNPKVNSSGGKNIPVFNKHAKSILKFTTPKLTTWGANENDFEGKKSYDMSLQMPSPEYATAESNEFLDNIKRFQDYIKQEAVVNSKKWFGKVHTAEVIDALYAPMLRYPKNKETEETDYTKAPSLRLKFPFWDGKFNVEVYNNSGVLIFPKPDVKITDVITKGSQASAIIQCGGIWFAGGKFGVTLKAFQIVTTPKPRLESGVCYLPLAGGGSPVRANASESVVSAEEATKVESDEEVDPEAEYNKPMETPTEPLVEAEPEKPGETPPPAPVKGKKKVVKAEA